MINQEQVIALIRQKESDRIERTTSLAKTFDLVPAMGTTLKDLDLDLFRHSYLPLAIDEELLAINGRKIEEQLASLRFYDLKHGCPTNAGIIMFGLKPTFVLPGAYIQYIRFSGNDLSSEIDFEKVFSGDLFSQLKVLDYFVKNIIIRERPVRKQSLQETIRRNYPFWALRELVLNAVLHRNYESNAPVYIYEFKDRIEIINPGGLYGDVNDKNFPFASDYRNIVIAEALKILGYVNRFNYGIQRANKELEKNENGLAVFDLTLITKFKVTIHISKNWSF